MRVSGLAAIAAALMLSACATAVPAPVWTGGSAGWTPTDAEVRAIGLGLPGGAMMTGGARFAGAVELVLEAGSPLHSLSDLKLIDADVFVAVTDAGDLVRGRLRLDGQARLAGGATLRYRRLTLADGTPIND